MWAEFDGDLDIPSGSMQRCSQRPQWVAVGHGGTAVERRHHPPSSPLIPSPLGTMGFFKMSAPSPDSGSKGQKSMF